MQVNHSQQCVDIILQISLIILVTHLKGMNIFKLQNVNYIGVALPRAIGIEAMTARSAVECPTIELS